MGCFSSTPSTENPPPDDLPPKEDVIENVVKNASSSVVVLSVADEGKEHLVPPYTGEQKQSSKKRENLGVVAENEEMKTPPIIPANVSSGDDDALTSAQREKLYDNTSGTSLSLLQSPPSTKSMGDRARTGHSTTYCDSEDSGVVPLGPEDEDSDYIQGSPSAEVLNSNGDELAPHARPTEELPYLDPPESGPTRPLHRRGTAPKGANGLQLESPGKVNKWDSSAVANLMQGLKRPGSIFNSQKRALFTPAEDEPDTGSHFQLKELPSNLIASGATVRHDLGTGPSQILKKLFIGTEADSDNAKGLAKFGITHILSLARASDHPQYVQKHWIMNDHGKSNVRKRWKELEKFMKSGMKRGKRVLVHCKSGQNRSATIVVLWLMHHGITGKGRMSLKDAHNFVVSKRPIVMINKNYRMQLREFDQELFKRHSTPETFGTMQTLLTPGDSDDSSEEETSNNNDLKAPVLSSDPEQDELDELKEDDRVSFDHEKIDTQRSNLSVPDTGNGSEAKPSSAEPSIGSPDGPHQPPDRLSTTKSCPPDVYLDELAADEDKPARSRVKTTPANARAAEDEFMGLLGALNGLGRKPMHRQKTAGVSRRYVKKPDLSRPKSLGTTSCEKDAPTKETIQHWKM